MPKTFDFDSNASGVAVRAVLTAYVTPRCAGDVEIDYHIDRLKNELEAMRRPLKAELLKRRADPNELPPP